MAFSNTVAYVRHMPTTDAELISTKEAAELLSESVRQTIRRVENGTLTPAKKLPGLRGAYIFDRTVIEALRTPQTTPSPDAPLASGEGVSSHVQGRDAA